MRLDEDERPSVLSPRTVAGALVVHLLVFCLVWGCAKIEFRPREIAVPIDLIVVVNENLDGKENEPPPVQEPPKPQEEKPKPRAEPPKPPDPPKEEVDAVEKVPEKPKKTKKELEEERIKRIRDSLKDKPKKPPEKPKEKPKTREELIREKLKGKPTNAKVTIKVDAPSGDGKTAKKTLSDAEIRKLLGEGYRPGATTQLAASEEQRCLSLIYNAFYSKWDRPAWNDTLREMHLQVSFGPGGSVVGYKLVQSSSDRAADMTVLRAAALVQVVNGLSEDFLRKHRNDIVLRFKVTPL